MIYVDENLCTGCGVCLAACGAGALSLRGESAFIDPALCSSCGRCIDVCLTEAIISAELVPDTPPFIAPVLRPERSAVWTGASSPSSLAPSARMSAEMASSPRVPADLEPPASPRLQIVEKVLSGLFSLATYALDRRRGRSSQLPTLSRITEDSAISMGRSAGRCQTASRRRGRDQSRRSGQGYGGGRGRTACGHNRRSRMT
jgi:NAD-dependent dihydropyrimidine dehydrogenase PreA subunit